jgi:hypothetical protein
MLVFKELFTFLKCIVPLGVVKLHLAKKEDPWNPLAGKAYQNIMDFQEKMDLTPNFPR